MKKGSPFRVESSSDGVSISKLPSCREPVLALPLPNAFTANFISPSLCVSMGSAEAPSGRCSCYGGFTRGFMAGGGGEDEEILSPPTGLVFYCSAEPAQRTWALGQWIRATGITQ